MINPQSKMLLEQEVLSYPVTLEQTRDTKRGTRVLFGRQKTLFPPQKKIFALFNSSFVYKPYC